MGDDEAMVHAVGALAKKFNVATMDFIDGEFGGKSVPVVAVMMAHLASISMLLAGIGEPDRQEDLQWFIDNAGNKLTDMTVASRGDYVAYRQKNGV
ncbi:MAG: hypothetical protein ABWY64_21525 [Tardiphaga sp.]